MSNVDAACSKCHGSEYIDDGCGVVLCSECGVPASAYELAVSQAESAGGLDVERLREAFLTVLTPENGKPITYTAVALALDEYARLTEAER